MVSTWPGWDTGTRMGHRDHPLCMLPVSPSAVGSSWGENRVCECTEEGRPNCFFLFSFFFFFLSQLQNSAGGDQSLRHTACHGVMVTICSETCQVLEAAACSVWVPLFDAMTWTGSPLLGQVRKASQGWGWSLIWAPSMGGPHIRASWSVCGAQGFTEWSRQGSV